jgi:hypothetical protein
MVRIFWLAGSLVVALALGAVGTAMTASPETWVQGHLIRGVGVVLLFWIWFVKPGTRVFSSKR